MPTDLTISAVAPVPPLPMPRGGGSGADSSADLANTTTAPPSPPPIYPNPSMYIDAAANLLVIAFRNAQGDVSDQIPTPQQLDAYRQTGLPDGTTP
jgi:hypothetical protein